VNRVTINAIVIELVELKIHARKRTD